jgi:hypothetical protein
MNPETLKDHCLVSCHACNVANNMISSLHERLFLGRIDYEEIHRDTDRRGAEIFN